MFNDAVGTYLGDWRLIYCLFKNTLFKSRIDGWRECMCTSFHRTRIVDAVLQQRIFGAADDIRQMHGETRAKFTSLSLYIHLNECAYFQKHRYCNS